MHTLRWRPVLTRVMIYSQAANSAAIACSGIDSCKITASIGSNLLCQGACMSARMVAS